MHFAGASRQREDNCRALAAQTLIHSGFLNDLSVMTLGKHLEQQGVLRLAGP